jgi:hypothetical protein
MGVCPVRKNIALLLRERTDKLVEKGVDGFDHFSPDLGCLCGICSIALRKALDNIGIKSKVLYGKFRGQYNHCWVESAGYIFDLTATQFNGVTRKVVILDKNSNLAKKWYKNGKEMINFSSFVNWPDYQKPKRKLIQTIHKGC